MKITFEILFKIIIETELKTYILKRYTNINEILSKNENEIILKNCFQT